jgi:hypothetical protein
MGEVEVQYRRRRIIPDLGAAGYGLAVAELD